MKRQKWEYTVEDITNHNCSCYGECDHIQRCTEDRLNVLGQEGWELVDATNKEIVIFKRPVEETITTIAPPKTELPNCTCAVRLWSGKHLPECPRGLKTGEIYPSWDDVPNDVLTAEKYETRNGYPPPKCDKHDGVDPWIYECDNGQCSICNLRQLTHRDKS